jgi:hypothetical protein
VMQMAVNALKLDNGHYNMLDKKNKKWELKSLSTKSAMSNYNDT